MTIRRNHDCVVFRPVVSPGKTGKQHSVSVRTCIFAKRPSPAGIREQDNTTSDFPQIPDPYRHHSNIQNGLILKLGKHV